MEMIQFASVVPERENLPYYIISMKWFEDWQAYTGCASRKDGEESEDIEEPRARHPGPINNNKQLTAILDLNERNRIDFNQEFSNNWHLKRGMKEDQHFKLVDREVWEILFNQYSGRLVPRTSVAVETEDPLRPDYIVESMYRQFEILTIPKVKYFQVELQQEIRVSNSDTIKELLQKIVQSDKFQ